MLLKLSKFFLYASIFSVLVVMPSTFFPFIGGKYYFFRIMVEMALAALLIFWGFYDKSGQIRDRLRETWKRPIFIAVSIFVIVNLLASIFAYDPHAAFWSNFERGEGTFQTIHYYIFFVLLNLLFKGWKEWRWVFILSLVAASLLILYGVFAQLGCKSFGLDGSCWMNRLISPYRSEAPPTAWGKLTETRFQGSLGNPSYVAPYLMFSLFYALYLWFRSRLKLKSLLTAGSIFAGFSLISGYLFIKLAIESGKLLSPPLAISPVVFLILGSLFLCGSLVYSFYKKELLTILYGCLIWFFTFFLILSKTRGAILGLVITALTFLIYLVFFLPKTYKKWSVIVLALFILTIGSLFYYRHTPLVQNLPGGRILELFDKGLEADSVQTRLWTWGSAWQGFKERPILGWGQENFNLVFDKYFDPRHYTPGQNSETWFDRAHSVFFDYLAETGLLGVLSYFGIFVVFYWQLFKRWSTNFANSAAAEPSPHSSIAIRGAFLVLPLAYIVQGLALFDVLPIYLNLFIFLSLSNYQLNSK